MNLYQHRGNTVVYTGEIELVDPLLPRKFTLSSSLEAEALCDLLNKLTEGNPYKINDMKRY